MAYTLNTGQQTPYTYQEYPRRMYQEGQTPCSVTSDDERAQREAEGWSISQDAVTPPAPPVEPFVPSESVSEPVTDVPRKGRKGRA